MPKQRGMILFLTLTILAMLMLTYAYMQENWRSAALIRQHDEQYWQAKAACDQELRQFNCARCEKTLLSQHDEQRDLICQNIHLRGVINQQNHQIVAWREVYT